MKNFSYRNAIVIGAGFAGIFMVYTIFNNFVPIFLAEFGLSATLVGFIMTWDNYFNMFLQPLVGQWSDQTYTKIGRRKPWLILGAPLAALAFITIPHVETVLWITGGVLCTNIGLALFRAPTVSLMGDLFPPHQRSTANSILNVMGGIGAILALVGGGLLYQYGRAWPFIFGSGVMSLAVLLLLLTIHEPQKKVGQASPHPIPVLGIVANIRQLDIFNHRSRLFVLFTVWFAFMGIQALQTWLSSFGKFGLGIDPGQMALYVVFFAISYLLMAVPSGLLANHFGRRSTVLIGLILLAGLLSLGWFIYNKTTLIIMLIITGAVWAFISINLLPMVYDVCPDTQIGMATGLYYLATTIAAIIGPQIAGILIDLTHKNYWMMFIVGAGCMVGGILCLLQTDDGQDKLRSG